MVRHQIANLTLRKGRVGSTPTFSANILNEISFLFPWPIIQQELDGCME